MQDDPIGLKISKLASNRIVNPSMAVDVPCRISSFCETAS
mgnify:CR=1 FL=1